MPTFNVATFFTQRITVACLHFGLLAALLLGVASARAEAPQATAQVPGYYHMTLGKFQVTALYDGPIALHTKLLKNVPAQDVQRLLARLFVKGPEVQTAVNAYVVNDRLPRTRGDRPARPHVFFGLAEAPPHPRG